MLYENDLQTIAPGAFDGLAGPVLTIDLKRNDLSSLPPRIFEKLKGLGGLSLQASTPAARVSCRPRRPGRRAGSTLLRAARVTLGVEGAENGFEDPWGNQRHILLVPDGGRRRDADGRAPPRARPSRRR